MSDAVRTKVTLKKPVQFGSETITELEIREPVAGDIRRLPANPVTGDILDLAAVLAGQPPAVINKLSIPDTLRVCKVVEGFISGGEETGAKR